MMILRHIAFGLVGLLYIPLIVWAGGRPIFQFGPELQLLVVFAPLLCAVCVGGSIATAKDKSP